VFPEHEPQPPFDLDSQEVIEQKLLAIIECLRFNFRTLFSPDSLLDSPDALFVVETVQDSVCAGLDVWSEEF
jgi:hypothetical protein